MNQETQLRELMTTILSGPEPRVGLDPHKAATQGRRFRRRRTFAATLALAALTASVGGGALFASANLSNSAGLNSASAGAADLPRVEPEPECEYANGCVDQGAVEVFADLRRLADRQIDPAQSLGRNYHGLRTVSLAFPGQPGHALGAFVKDATFSPRAKLSPADICFTGPEAPGITASCRTRSLPGGSILANLEWRYESPAMAKRQAFVYRPDGGSVEVFETAPPAADVAVSSERLGEMALSLNGKYREKAAPAGDPMQPWLMGDAASVTSPKLSHAGRVYLGRVLRATGARIEPTLSEVENTGDGLQLRLSGPYERRLFMERGSEAMGGRGICIKPKRVKPGDDDGTDGFVGPCATQKLADGTLQSIRTAKTPQLVAPQVPLAFKTDVLLSHPDGTWEWAEEDGSGNPNATPQQLLGWLAAVRGKP